MLRGPWSRSRRRYVSGVWLPVVAALVLPGAALAQPVPPARLSVATDGTEANGPSQFIGASRDGRHVLFTSTASNLVPGGSSASQLFIRDRDTDRDGVFDEPGAVATILVSEGLAGQQSSGSGTGRLTPDGRFVLFSAATPLVDGDTNGLEDVYLRDRDADGDGIFDEAGAVSVTRVSTGSGGFEANGASGASAITPDGRYVVFGSIATNLYDRPIGSGVQQYRKDRLTGLTTILTIRQDGSPIGHDGLTLTLSANGRYAAMGEGSVTPSPTWLIRDLLLGTFVPVTAPVGTAGAVASAASPAIASPLLVSLSVVHDFTPDGSHVVLGFQTLAVLGSFASLGGTLYDYDVTAGRIIRSFPGVGRLVVSTSPSLDIDDASVGYASSSVTGDLCSPAAELGRSLYQRSTGRITPIVAGRINRAQAAADGRLLLYEDSTCNVSTPLPITTYLWDAVYDTPLPMPAPVHAGWLDAAGTMTIFTTVDAAILAPGVDTNGVTDVFAVDLVSRLDRDGDGLDDRWEIAMGLDYTSGAGVDGPAGDPDGDGATNAQEFTAATHPRGASRELLAEGADNAFFKTRLAIANPGTTDTTAVVRFDGDGTARTRNVHVPPGTRQTVFVDEVDGHALSFATVIESSVPLVAERTMSWDHTEYGAHAERATPAPATTWFLAEGSTTSFSLFYLLQNPGDTAASATIRYLRPAPLTPIERTYPLPAHSRTTIPVNTQGDELAAVDVSASITATQPILVERAMYRSTPTQVFAAGHASAGVTAPATSWFLAEGATGPFFDLFVLLANPGTTAADVEIRYLLSTGDVLTKTYTVAAESRRTIYVDAEDIPGQGQVLGNVNVSCAITSTNAVPIVVERAMWFPGPAITPNFWTEAHNSSGATATATRWVLADGDSGGTRAAQTFLLIANTSATPGRVRITRLLDSPSALPPGQTNYSETLDLLPNSRTTIALHQTFGTGSFGVVVESIDTTPLAELVVERAMYWNAGGEIWAAGTNLLATPVP